MDLNDLAGIDLRSLEGFENQNLLVYAEHKQVTKVELDSFAAQVIQMVADEYKKSMMFGMACDIAEHGLKMSFGKDAERFVDKLVQREVAKTGNGGKIKLEEKYIYGCAITLALCDRMGIKISSTFELDSLMKDAETVAKLMLTACKMLGITSDMVPSGIVDLTNAYVSADFFAKEIKKLIENGAMVRMSKFNGTFEEYVNSISGALNTIATDALVHGVSASEDYQSKLSIAATISKVNDLNIDIANLVEKVGMEKTGENLFAALEAIFNTVSNDGFNINEGGEM